MLRFYFGGQACKSVFLCYDQNICSEALKSLSSMVTRKENAKYIVNKRKGLDAALHAASKNSKDENYLEKLIAFFNKVFPRR